MKKFILSNLIFHTLCVLAIISLTVACNKESLDSTNSSTEQALNKEIISVTYHYGSENFSTKAEISTFENGKSKHKFIEGNDLERLETLLKQPNVGLYIYKPDEVYVYTDDTEMAKIHKSLTKQTTISGITADTRAANCTEGCPIPANQFICQPKVWLYRHCGYGTQMYYHAVPLSGKVENPWVGSYNNDNLSGVIASPGQFRSVVNNQVYNITTLVRLYEHDNYGGHTVTINANWLGQCTNTAFVSCLTNYPMGCCNNFDNEMSSYKILLCY